MTELRHLPVAVIGAGPVGLAAGAHLLSRGLTPVILEASPSVAASLRAWGHVRVFSPWRYIVDATAGRLLETSGWQAPDPEALPTGAEIVERYLAPLESHPALAPHILFNAGVSAVTRQGLDKMSNAGREEAPFVIRYVDGQGEDRRLLASAVLDASGTWNRPNPAGIDGLPVQGEKAAATRVAYGIPDVLGEVRAAYQDRHVLVIGSGHSAINAVLALLDLQGEAPATRVSWGLRSNRLQRLLGGGLNDQLPARGALGLAAGRAIADGRLDLLVPFDLQRIETQGEGLLLNASVAGQDRILAVDRIIVATGFRPDLSIAGELRLDLDPSVEAPRRLAPMIDPNLHSCGSVPPHGVDELAHPEAGFYIVGSKSYGRAPTFLMATGYEQVRSVVADLAGDPVAARQVHLVLPETGVCSSAEIDGDDGSGKSSCCGGPPPAGADACCAADATAKAEGATGCGCGTPAATQHLAPEPAE
ncbi:flavoprotein [Agrobacterium sp. a22-2]|uniref:flavoprotein n=1 Tax=Agrobacterium sp. a22-2 TaxID=2283840 RepID=UPI0014454556|nr:flavoprotein [Agrobacterium sp. a22-2]NKN39497.1 flavoprotein [Agrobacterium sp. a22-2]